jgi:hypothetical protein
VRKKRIKSAPESRPWCLNQTHPELATSCPSRSWARDWHPLESSPRPHPASPAASTCSSATSSASTGWKVVGRVCGSRPPTSAVGAARCAGLRRRRCPTELSYGAWPALVASSGRCRRHREAAEVDGPAITSGRRGAAGYELTLTRTVSQMCHAFAEPAGHGRTPEDTPACEIEYRRTLAEPAGHWRTRHTQGSGP